MPQYLVQFLDRRGSVVGEYSANAEGLNGVFDQLLSLEWPIEALGFSVFDHMGQEIHSAVIGVPELAVRAFTTPRARRN